MPGLNLNSFRLVLCLCFLWINSALSQSLTQPWYITPRSGNQHIELSGSWDLAFMDTSISKLEQLVNKKDVFKTTVPNSIHWSLFKAGKLPHPYYNLNSVQYKWTDEKAWYYTRSFDMPATSKDKFVFLCFDGVDYFTKVWINDSLIGTHEGMFGGPNAEISRFLKYGQPNAITVEVTAGNWGNKARDVKDLPRVVSGRIDFDKRPGFNPRASGRIVKPWVISGGSGGEAFFSVGMWQGVRIEIAPKIHLERPYLTTKSITAGKSSLHLSTEIFSNAHSLQQQLHPWNNTQIRHPNENGVPFIPVKENISVIVEMSTNGKVAIRKEFRPKLYEGRNWLEEDFELTNPLLWNPTGLGQPNLYQVTVSLKRNDEVVDKSVFNYGIRSVERVPGAGPKTGDRFDNWQFIVNGKKIFVKGMNFTPQDILLETSEDRYRWTLSAAKKMGIQLIRIWGGGLLETNTLYKICDELGIMVWQDFPIGNQDTPEYPQEVWEAQVVQNIIRLRNHPSLVIWCGGNEFNPYSNGNAASIGILERNLRTFDPSRFFVRTTPDHGSIHVYPDMDPTWYNKSYGKEAWISETGMHSMPEPSLFYETVNNSEFKGLGRMWDTAFAAEHPEFIHHFTEYGPSRVPRMLSRASHISDMNDPTIEAVSEATQIGAAEFYQVFSEKTQANYPVTTGLMPWVFKRHWPVIAIQLMDWFGHAGAPYYFMKRTYEATHVSIDIDRLLWAPGEKIDLNLKVLSSYDKTTTGLKATVTGYDDSFKQIFAKERSVSPAVGTIVTTVSAGTLDIPRDYTDRYLFLLAELKDANGKLVSRSFYYPRVLSKMQDTAFYNKYMSEPIAWITFEKGPWLKPVVQQSATSLSLQLGTNKKISDTESELKVMVKNTGKFPAFMTKVDIKGVKRSFYATDNFFWLQPGETRQISMNILWREQNKNATAVVSAWNAPAAEQKLN
ncbi:MAG: beta-mannosidase [Chitinophagaceae bacterium]|nr:MAG: beta-mannosidase [Chitinophagaceae bacterium]